MMHTRLNTFRLKNRKERPMEANHGIENMMTSPSLSIKLDMLSSTCLINAKRLGLSDHRPANLEVQFTYFGTISHMINKAFPTPELLEANGAVKVMTYR